MGSCCPSKDFEKEFIQKSLYYYKLAFSKRPTRNVLILANEEEIRNVQLETQSVIKDGFRTIRGNNLADIDCFFSLNSLIPLLEFIKPINNPEAPADVIVEVAPYFHISQPETNILELIKYIEYTNGKYLLNIKKLRELFSEKIYSNLLESYSRDPQPVISESRSKCFRIEFIYTGFTMLNHFSIQISYLNGFIDNYGIKVKEGIIHLLKNIALQYVSRGSWERFKTELQPSASRTCIKYVDLKIEDRSCILMGKHFKEVMKIIEEFLDNSSFFYNFYLSFQMTEHTFYMFLSMLLSCGISTILPIILNKELLLLPEHQIYYEIRFNEGNISEIIDIDFQTIFQTPINKHQIKLERKMCTKINKHLHKTKNILKNLGMKYKIKMPNYHDFTKENMNDLDKDRMYDQSAWLLSIISKLTALYEDTKHILSYYKSIEIIQRRNYLHYIDVIPGIKFEDWPSFANEWITRKRFWPTSELVQKVSESGFHVIFKSSKNNNEYGGRLSFTGAERLLCEAMTYDQKIVYYFLTNIFKWEKIKQIESYHIKSICFGVFESQDLTDNSENQRKGYIRLIIKRLFTALSDHYLPHYFLPGHNLFIDFVDEDYEEINEQLQLIFSKDMPVSLLKKIVNNNPLIEERNCMPLLVDNLFNKLTYHYLVQL